MNIDTLIISAGGTNGYIFIGILKYLNEIKLLNNIKKYIGCSIGSILCFLLSINYSIKEMEELVIDLDINKLLNDFNLNLLIKYKCIYNNYKIVKFLKELLIKKGINENITLAEHYKLFNKKITIIVSNITSNKCEYISYKNYPNLKLWKGILMSISIPLVFPYVIYNNCNYLDGALYDMIGILKIKQKYLNNNNILVITYINKNNTDNKNNIDNKNNKDNIDNKDNIISQYLNINNFDKIYDLINYISKCSTTFINESSNNTKFILLNNYKYFYCYNNSIEKNNIYNYFNLIINKDNIINMITKGYNYA
jgi:predicted acylesterase/phospholipase RssA